jgi:hypothetical protein
MMLTQSHALPGLSVVTPGSGHGTARSAKARQRKFWRVMECRGSAVMDWHCSSCPGRAMLVAAAARYGMSSQGLARSGSSVAASRAAVRHGILWRCRSCHGRASRGMAVTEWPGTIGPGASWRGWASRGGPGDSRHGTSSRVAARLGVPRHVGAVQARHHWVRLGELCPVGVGLGLASYRGPGPARSVGVRCVMSVPAAIRLGALRQPMAGREQSLPVTGSIR